MPFAGLISWFGLTLFNREQRSEVFSRKHTIKGKLNRLQGTKLLFNHRSRRVRFNREQRSKIFNRKHTIKGKFNRLHGMKLLFNHRSRRIRFNRGQRSKVFSRKETIEVTSGL